MKVSVVCPLYNKVDYIGETILSVRKQSYENWEMIIVDDGSTDGSFDLVKEYAETDSRIKLFDREQISSNKGANVCRNIGIDHSEADYIIFLDADDLLTPYCLKQRTDAIKQNPGLSFYIFNVAYCKGEDAVPYAKLRPSMINRIKYSLASNKKEYFLRKFLKFDLAWHTSGPIWDRKYLKSVGGFNEKFQRLQDPEMHTRVLLDASLSFKYLMHRSTYDVLHRTDDDRVVWDKHEFFIKRMSSITQYLNVFIPIIKEQKEHYLYKLQGYLLQAETLAYRGIRDESNIGNIDFYFNEINRYYNSLEGKKISNWAYRRFLIAFRWSLKYRFFIKLKIPGILLLFYKKIVL